MKSKSNNHRAESFTEGMTPVQSFTTPALPVPPGTPAKPRQDRLHVAVREKGTQRRKSRVRKKA